MSAPVHIYTYSGRRHVTEQPDFKPVSRWEVGFYPSACNGNIWGRKEPIHGEDPEAMPRCKRCEAKVAKA